MALTLAQMRALQTPKAKRGKKPVTLPALQALKSGELHVFGPAAGYADEQSARSARSAIESAARKASISGEAFEWTEPAMEAKGDTPAAPARHWVTFVRA